MSFLSSRTLGLADRDLRGLDDALSERGVTLISGLFVDERPPGGLLGLVDWRMNGDISRRCLDGWVTGVDGERVLMPGRVGLSAERLVVMGLGFRSGFDEGRYTRAIRAFVDVLVGLGPRRVVLELPGRHVGAIEPLTAMTGLVEAIEARRQDFEVESVVVVDDRAAQKAWDTKGRRR